VPLIDRLLPAALYEWIRPKTTPVTVNPRMRWTRVWPAASNVQAVYPVHRGDL
jgi:hypothetical protein